MTEGMDLGRLKILGDKPKIRSRGLSLCGKQICGAGHAQIDGGTENERHTFTG
ncbi:hypothetical protein GCM10007875_17920 [Limnobacter litoralis]|uniref:Uncharacterized protein n=1 Tax=Limnobacter litoralis TaxID=481366 RepID=A0ABQ5YW40_9BURK|nr:hypothetical protein GCM10007875_17920 [Limnobacter litoralis]